jgi:hypothetical protein
MEREEMRGFILFRLTFAPKLPALVTAKMTVMRTTAAPLVAGAKENFPIKKNFNLLAILYLGTNGVAPLLPVTGEE